MSIQVKGGSNMETEQKSDTITISKNSLWKYSTFVLLGIIILGFIFVLGDKSPTGNVIQQPGQNLPSEPTAKVKVDIEGAPMKGKSDAKVTIVEFSDYECPFCARAFAQSMNSINAYIENGKAQVAFKDYPLPFHPQAQKAAEAAHCARKQGGDAKYWAMHDLLFTSGVDGGVASFKEYAQQLGLSTNQFNSCLDSGEFEGKVKANLQYGSTIGVQGTPAFFINGRLISGACPDSTFKQAMDAELTGDDWTVSNCNFVKL